MTPPDRRIGIPVEFQTVFPYTSETKDRKAGNPHIPRLRALGFRTEYPTAYRDRSLFPPEAMFDSLTGLPEEEGPVRLGIVAMLGHAVQTGQRFVLATRDFDNLKIANKHGKQFGDAGIVVDTAEFVSQIEDLGLNGVSVVVTRATGAADETNGWFFGLSEAQSAALARSVQQSNRTQRVYYEKDFTFASSTGLVTSDTLEIQDTLAAVRANPNNLFVFYNDIRDRADTKGGILKIAKDLSRLPGNEVRAAGTVEDIIAIFTDRLSGTRIGRDLLKTSYNIVRDETIIDQLIAPMSADDIPMLLGLTEHRELLSRDEIRTRYYQNLVASILAKIDEKIAKT